MNARTRRVNSSGEMPSHRLVRAMAMRSRPSSPIAAVSWPAGPSNSGVCAKSGSDALAPQRVDEEVELDVARALAPQGAVVVEARDPLLRRHVEHVVEERHERVAGGPGAPGGEQVVRHGRPPRVRGRGSSHAAEARRGSCPVSIGLRSPRRRPVAQAVGVGAQVGAALDDLAPDAELRLRRVVARLQVTAARVVRRAARRACVVGVSAASTSRPSTPRRCRPCRRARSRWPGSCRPARCAGTRSRRSCATGSRDRPRCWPSAFPRAGRPHPRCTPSRRGRRGRRTPTRPRSAATPPPRTRRRARPRGRRAPRDGRAAGRRSSSVLAGASSWRRASSATTG